MPSLTGNRQSVTIKIDTERQLRFNWSATCRFEEVYGKSVPAALRDDIGPRVITHLAWAGMLHAEPQLQVRMVEKRLQAFLNAGGDITALASDLIKALVSSGVLGKPAEEPTDGEAVQDPPSETEDQN